MHIGPDSLIVAARVALADEMAADQTEDLADEIDSRLSERLPAQPHVFIDPTQNGGIGSRETGEAPRAAWALLPCPHPDRVTRSGCPRRAGEAR
ncbi:MAG TPA: hypothetical protein VF838_19220 [Trebonia sp.]